MFLFAGLIGLFPKHLPKKKKKIEHEKDGEKCDQSIEMLEKHENNEIDAQLKSMTGNDRKIF